MSRRKLLGRKLGRLLRAIALCVALVLFFYMAIARIFTGVLPDWGLIPIGIGLILFAILLPYDGSEKREQEQDDVPDA